MIKFDGCCNGFKIDNVFFFVVVKNIESVCYCFYCVMFFSCKDMC